MISSVCWVPRGASKFKPDFSEPTEEELEGIRAQASSLSEFEEEIRRQEDEMDDEDDEDDDEEEEEDLDEDTKSAVEKARAIAEAIGNTNSTSNQMADDEDLAKELAELDMDNYDNEKDDHVRLFGNGGLGIAYYKNEEEDPYIVLKDDEDEEEIEDLTIKDSDLLILTARTEDDVSHLEVWVCEEGSQDPGEELNMYVHHDIILSAFPLSLAWLDFKPNQDDKANLVAVGTMQPEIEIWDLDMMDTVEPLVVLGGTIVEDNGNNTEKISKKKKQKPKFKEGSHTDSVLSLSWNKEYRNVIASGSADKSIKVWDIATQVCQHTMNHHTDKVQSVAWNPKEPTVLLSGSFDKTVGLSDMRHSNQEAIKWNVNSDVECLAWNIHDPFYFVVTTEDGLLRYFDVRKGGSQKSNGKKEKGSSSHSMDPVFTLEAHDKATCSISFNSEIPNLIATASTDKMVKLWDISNNTPVCVTSQNPKLGAIFSVSFCQDSPYLLAMGGSKGKLKVWNVSQESNVIQRFPIRR